MAKKKMYIGHWNCKSCGHTNDAIIMSSDGKPIRILHCMSCGSPIPKNGKNGGSPYWIEDNLSDRKVLDEKYHHLFGKPNWKCSSCGMDVPDAKEFPRCPTCGNPKDDSDETRIKYEVGKKTEHIKEGLNLTVEHWTCEYCDTETPVTESKCSSCGHPRYEEKVTQTSTNNYFEYPKVENKVYRNERVYSSSSKSWWKPLAIVGGVALFAWLIWFFFIATIEKTGQISDKSWSRSVTIEDYAERQREAWEGQVPSDGKVYDTYEDVYEYKKVFDHTEIKTKTVVVGQEEYVCGTIDNGDGTFEDKMCTRDITEEQEYTEDVYRDEPVYKTKCKYTIWEWEYDRKELTYGSVSQNTGNPYWYAVTASDERDAGRSSEYLIHISTEDGRTYDDEHTQAEWEQFIINQKVTIKVTRTGNVKEIVLN